MTEQAEQSVELSPTERLTQLLQTVEAGSPRHQTLSAALDFKGSWIELGRHLKKVEDGALWEQWDYQSLAAYCREELQLGRGDVRKLREGYQWLEQEAPQLLEPEDQARDPDGARPPAPNIEVVQQLARGWQHYHEDRIPEDTYMELKRAALQGERSASQLRREFKEAVPEHLRDQPAPNPKRHLKRALNALEKALNDATQDVEGEYAPELFDKVRELRDEIFHLVAQKPD